MYLKNLGTLLTAAAFCLFLTSCKGTSESKKDPGSGVTPVTSPPIVLPDPVVSVSGISLPIEVYPDLTTNEYNSLYSETSQEDGSTLVVYRDFSLDDTSSAVKLRVKGHRLGYTDYHLNSERDEKTYVKINNSPWVRIDNENSELSSLDEAYGGIGGGFRTNDLKLNLSLFNTSLENENRIYFKMGASDGVTNGFRILDFQILNSADENLITDSYYIEDPDSWETPTTDPAQIDEGRFLFNARDILTDRGLNITASCVDCHAKGGRDLEYFSFSTGSIVARSKFHGLSFDQGLKIASYIRANSAERHGRPWNPPYQPGPGLDSRPVDEWAAGAGLEAVLENDAALVQHVFPNGNSKSNIKAIIQNGYNSSINQLNAREIPVPIQLPDWNDWLPTIHPIDIWGAYYSQYLEARNYGFEHLEDRIESAMNSGLYGYENKNSAGFLMERLTNDVYRFMVQGSIERDYPLRVRRGAIIDNKLLSISDELATNSMTKLMVVKTFDIMTRLGIEDKAKLVYGSDLAERRQWPVRKFSAFAVAPHLYSLNRNNFDSPDFYQSSLKGQYDSVAWYHLQIVLNSGGKVRNAIYPVDWDYQYDFLKRLSRTSGVQTPVLEMMTLIKGFQNNMNPFGIGPKGFMKRFTRPHWILNPSIRNMSDTTFRTNFMDAFMENYIERMSDFYSIMQWDANRFYNESDPLIDQWTRLKTPNYQPNAATPGAYFNNSAENAFTLAYILERDSLLSEQVLFDYAKLAKELWPKGAFELYSPYSNTSLMVPTGTEMSLGQSFETNFFRLEFKTDGDLVLIDKNNGLSVWSTQTSGSGSRAVIENNGNLVVFDSSNNVLYQTGTRNGHPLLISDLIGLKMGDFLVSRTLEANQAHEIYMGTVYSAGRNKLIFQNDGNLVAYNSINEVLWASDTNGLATRLVLSEDGYLEFYNSSDRIIKTYGNGGSPYMKLDDQSFVVSGETVYNVDVNVNQYVTPPSINHEATVRSVYLDVLNREADYDGLSFYINAMNQGFTESEVRQDLLNSSERQIIDLYQLHLQRAPDQGGLDFYLNLVNGGYPISSVKRDLQTSPSCQFECL